MSYTLLTQSEAAHHYRTVAGTTGLPLCVYDNPGTTHFAFSDDLIADFAATLSIAAIKMPLPADEEVPTQVTRLRARVPTGFSIGYSNDWGAAEALLAGADAWYSVVVGLLPTPALALTRASEAGDTTTVRCLDDAFRPM